MTSSNDVASTQPPLAIDYTPSTTNITTTSSLAPTIPVTSSLSNILHTVSLDALGPVIVNEDGTMSRISNWDSLTDAEQRNTLRVLGKPRLKAEEDAKEASS
ncbi:hypothetical protein BC829DRAFT_388610 [Chytridium lagenaria]|nr:hypothetical protein BC829DRAFT_388610 [Chytridium lagenaria]